MCRLVIWCLSSVKQILLISWTRSPLSLSYFCGRAGVACLLLACCSVHVCCTIRSMPEVTSGSEGELSGTGVVVVLWLSDVGVSIHGEVHFLQVWGGLVVILGDSGALLLPGHFLIDGNRRLPSVMMPHLHLQHITLFLTCLELISVQYGKLTSFCTLYCIYPSVY